MSISNPFLNRAFHTGFYSILYIATSPILQLLVYQVIKFRHPWYNLGLFHLLVILYFPSMIIALFYTFYQLSNKWDSFTRSPFFLSFSQIFTLAILTAAQICCDFLALTLNTSRDIQMQSTGDMKSLIHWDLIRFLMLQLMFQILLTPLFNKLILCNKVKSWQSYFCVSGYALLLFLVFEFVTFNESSTVVNSLDLYA